MSRRPSPAVLLLVLVSLSAIAASTRITKSWKDPKAGLLDLKKVLVACIGKDPFLRQTCEKEFVSEMKFAQGVSAMTVLTEAEIRDKVKAGPILKAQGFDGAIVIRLAGVKTQEKQVEGDYPHEYYAFWDYWDSEWPQVSPMTFQESETSVHIQVNLYTLKDEKLVWTGQCATVNPADIPRLVDGVAQAVFRDFKKKGLIK